MIATFWRQENAAYRNMQVAFTLLTLNFVVPSIGYFFTPETAFAQFLSIGRMLGGIDYPLREESHLWRVLAAGNVFTLGFICFLLQLNVRRFAAAIPVFAVLKSFSALGYLWVFLFEVPYRLFLVVFFWDALAVFLVVFLGTRALRALERMGPDGPARLVPRLRFER